MLLVSCITTDTLQPSHALEGENLIIAGRFESFFGYHQWSGETYSAGKWDFEWCSSHMCGKQQLNFIPAVVLVIMVCSNVWNSRGVDATVDCLCRSHGGIISRLPAFSSFLSQKILDSSIPFTTVFRRQRWMSLQNEQSYLHDCARKVMGLTAAPMVVSQF